jgi:TRAP transporter TAXI family solute receptor
MKKFQSIIVCVLLVTVLIVPAYGFTGNAENHEEATISISTGGTTGMYFTTHSPISSYINESSKWLRIVPITSGGSTENLANVLNGIAELGCVYTDQVLSGYENNKSLRFVGPTTDCSPLQFVVLSESEIHDIKDIKGKVVHIGSAGSGARTWTYLFFDWLGIKSEFTESPLSNEEVVDALRDGDVVMFTVGGLAPSARVTSAAETYNVRLLDLSAYTDAFIEKYPYFEKYIIKAGTYKGVDYDVVTFGLATSIVCLEDMDYDILYEWMTWAYSEEAQKAANTTNPIGPEHNPAVAGYDPFANQVIPLHQAAKDFWESKGFVTTATK